MIHRMIYKQMENITHIINVQFSFKINVTFHNMRLIQESHVFTTDNSCVFCGRALESRTNNDSCRGKNTSEMF